jgi:hypothetical protein
LLKRLVSEFALTGGIAGRLFEAGQHSVHFLHPVTVWVDSESGEAEARTMPMQVLQREAARLATVRMRRFRPAA